MEPVDIKDRLCAYIYNMYQFDVYIKIIVKELFIYSWRPGKSQTYQVAWEAGNSERDIV